MQNKSINVLMVEDDASDVELAREAMSRCVKPGLDVRFSVAPGGEEAIEYLQRKGEYQDAPRPNLIFLDLNMPRINGFEVLKLVKEDRALSSIPVVVMTTSNSTADVEKSYRMGANCFITKAKNFSEYLKVMQSIENFWFNVTSLP